MSQGISCPSKSTSQPFVLYLLFLRLTCRDYINGHHCPLVSIGFGQQKKESKFKIFTSTAVLLCGCLTDTHAQLLPLLSPCCHELSFDSAHLAHSFANNSSLKLPGMITIRRCYLPQLAGWLINNSMLTFYGIWKMAEVYPELSQHLRLYLYNVTLKWIWFCSLEIWAPMQAKIDQWLLDTNYFPKLLGI